MGRHIVSLLDSAGGGGGSLPPKIINVPGDFPTILEAYADIGRFYIAAADVTDNDPTKTNTGQSFLSGEEFIWNGVVPTGAYVKVGPDALWLDDGTDYKSISPPRNIDLQNKELKNVSKTKTSILELSTGTTVNEIASVMPVTPTNDQLLTADGIKNAIATSGLVVKDLTSQLGAGGVVSFTLDSTPAAVSKSLLFYNGQIQIYGINYTISGTTLTWITTPPSFALSADDGTNSFWIYYDVTVSPMHPPTAFKAEVNSDHIGVTGDGTAYTVLFQDDSTSGFYDLQNNYNPATGQYTAAFDQIFPVGVALLLGGTINPTHEISALFAHRNSGGSVIGSTTFTENKAGVIINSAGNIIVSGYAEFNLSVGDTVEVAVIGAGSTKTINVINTSSQFYGHVAITL